MTRVAIDTNILVYAEGLGEGAKVDRAIDVIAQLNPVTTLIPVQVLGELTRVNSPRTCTGMSVVTGFN